MSPPDSWTIDTALTALTGTVTEARPETDLDANLLRLRLIGQAQAAGISWNMIGRVLGMTGKEAKRHVKRLGARTQRDYVQSLAPERVPVPHSAAVAAVKRSREREGVTPAPVKPRKPPARKRPHHVRRRGR